MNEVLRLLTFLQMIAFGITSVFTNEQTVLLENFVAEIMNCHQMPGMTVAAVKGEEIWTSGFGFADKDQGEKVESSSTLFGIGSLTKAFTTVLLAKLLNETGQSYTWDSKLTHILGANFRLANQLDKTMTLKDILTHRTGLQRADLGLFAGYSENITRANFARRMQFLPEMYPFRDEFHYNNWMYTLAGHVVEVLSQESWEDALENEILKPLKMIRTKVIGKTIDVNSTNFSKPYVFTDGKMELSDYTIYNIYPAEPAGAIASTADDMAKWLHFLIRNGEIKDGLFVLNSKKLQETFETYINLPKAFAERALTKPTFPVSDIQVGYGYGWFTANYRGYKKIWHSGGLHAYITYLAFFPDVDAGVFFSVNGRGKRAGTSTMLNFLSDMILGLEPWLNSTTACSFPLPWKTPNNSSVTDDDITNDAITVVQRYEGSYGHQFFGDLRIKGSPGGNGLLLYYGRLEGTLNTTEQKNKFKMDAVGAYRFLTNPGNKTQFISVTFDDLKDGKYNKVSIIFPKPMTFLRGVKFTDPIKPENPKPPNSKETIHPDTALTILVGFFICVFSFE